MSMPALSHSLKSLISVNSIKFWFRILVTTSIFILIFRSIHINQLWVTLKQAGLGLLLVALLMQFGSTSLSAYRWQIIMHNLSFGQPLSFYWRSYFKASFFNQGLPTSIGGDALKVLDVAGQGFRKRDALYGIMLDRVTGLAALMWLNLAAYLINPNLLPSPIYHLTLLLVVGSLVGFMIASSLRHLPWLNAYSRLRIVITLSERLHQAFLNNRILLIGSSLLIPILAMLSIFMTGSALGLRYNLVTYFIIVPPAILLTIIPISMAGWGIREGTLVALFSLIGADKATILAMSILYGLMQIIVSLPGFIIYLSGRKNLP
ncbi:MAG TPA: lysylphosphatidylglycerol synthase transmembrane domain-containing protein [Candidatus Competibacteraceae bacterium]|nr:lysylphosphatidylglycerol synthase transmembrane domain-containing protein [Candidatus Competibacteraceae bacterium]